ncbi:class C sortase [Lacticaseibacillus mingshuiensis]|uniref:class C sortase n=1 Tax=Lacticaseibacillus mingshuiensis TaxID=2799574 RepID=UPI001CED4D3D|nr:class C sortase [Lacticaseibacillus mingshuiensis]
MRHWSDRTFYLFFGFLFALGLILLLLPFGFDVYHDYQSKQATVVYEKNAKSPTSKQTKDIEAYNAMIAAFQQGQPPKRKVKITDIQPDLHDPIGFVRIPAIHIAGQTMYFDDSDWVLDRAIGTMPGTSLPSGGTNTLTVITGHSGLANRIVFDNIRYLKNGDIFYVTSFGQEKAYQVYQQKVVDPNAKSAIKATYVQPHKDIAVLLTCTPLFINTHRLMVYGKRVSLKTAASHTVTTRDGWGIERLWILIVILLLLLILIWFLIKQHQRRKEKEKANAEKAAQEQAAREAGERDAGQPAELGTHQPGEPGEPRPGEPGDTDGH